MAVETDGHLGDSCRLRSIEITQQNAVVVLEPLAMGVVPGIGAVVEIGDEAEVLPRTPVVG